MVIHPTLIRAPGLAEMRRGAAHILREHPCHRIWFSHVGDRTSDQTVLDLMAGGITFYRGFNALHVRETAGNWNPLSAERRIYDVFEQGDGTRDWWLRDRNGDLVRYKFSDTSDPDRIPDWSLMTREVAREFAAFVRGGHPDGPYIVDHCWALLDRVWTDWVFLGEVRIDDLHEDFCPTKWMNGLRWTLQGLGWPGVGCVTNGGKRFTQASDVGGNGRAFMIENADTQRYWGGIFSAVATWQRHPYSILSLAGPPDSWKVEHVLRVWVERGGLLWCEKKSTADRAWRMIA